MKSTEDQLREEISKLRLENEALRKQNDNPPSTHNVPSSTLTNEEIARFSRQLLIPEIGVQGQIKIRNAAVLVVGAGGLGAPAIMYLAAAGIGRLGVVDYDPVEGSNLQRQIIHDQTKIGVLKAESARMTVNKLSSFCDCIPHNVLLDSSNAMDIISDYDIVMDATDNVATRYLLNDACVLLKKPLVSGSALRMEGQLTVYNYENGPCYRCIFPKPPPAETVTNCSDGGVLGVVPGIIGCVQALEVIKICTGIGSTYSQKMLLFDAIQGTFRNIKLRGRRPECAVCGDTPTITKLIDYVQFCGSSATDKAENLDLLDPSDRLTVQEYRELVISAKSHILLDVRDQVQFNICSLPNSKNIPLRNLESRVAEVSSLPDAPVFVVCRRGNDSQVAIQILQKHGLRGKDIVGGLEQWAAEIDPQFPTY